FFVGPEIGPQCLVFRRSRPAPAGALDGTAGKVARGVELEKAFRRRGKNVPLRKTQEGGIGRGVDAAQYPVNLERIGGSLRAQFIGEAGLIGFAAPDGLLQESDMP